MIDKSCTQKNYSTTRLLIQGESSPPAFFDETFTSLNYLPPNNERFDEGGSRFLGLHKKSSSCRPLITVIVAVFNGKTHIEKTILSVLNQTYDNVELIIIDGGSSDGTLNLLKKYNDAIDYWVSEKDKGISDAFNKGVMLASGDFINFQGDGDGFYKNNVLKEMFDKKEFQEQAFVCGRIQRISIEGKAMFVSAFSAKFRKQSLLFRMSLPHQALFTSMSYFKKHGLFDVNNTFCMDYEHLLRAYRNFPNVVTQDIIVANWRADGLGNGRDLAIFKEYNKIKKDNRIAPIPILMLIHVWTLFKFYIKKVIK